MKLDQISTVTVQESPDACRLDCIFRLSSPLSLVVYKKSELMLMRRATASV